MLVCDVVDLEPTAAEDQEGGINACVTKENARAVQARFIIICTMLNTIDGIPSIFQHV